MTIPPTVAELVATAPLAHLTTLNPDGSPQTTVVWIGIEHDELVIGHMFAHRKVRNIRRDPRVTLSFLGTRTNANGLHEYVVVKGTARITEGGAADLLQSLAHRYLGPDVSFPPEEIRDLPGFARIRVDSISGVGPWAEKGR